MADSGKGRSLQTNPLTEPLCVLVTGRARFEIRDGNVHTITRQAGWTFDIVMSLPVQRRTNAAMARFLKAYDAGRADYFYNRCEVPAPIFTVPPPGPASRITVFVTDAPEFELVGYPPDELVRSISPSGDGTLDRLRTLDDFRELHTSAEAAIKRYDVRNAMRAETSIIPICELCVRHDLPRA
jgi:hypothetical protein